MVLDLSVAEKDRLLRLACLGLTHTEKKLASDDKLLKKLSRSMKQIKPRSAKNKGASWQKEMCEMISRITGVAFNQQDDACEIHSREMGLSGADIIVRGNARSLFDLDPECKNCTSISLPEWVRQAKSNAKDGKWVIFVKSPKLEENVAILSVGQFELMSINAANWREES